MLSVRVFDGLWNRMNLRSRMRAFIKEMIWDSDHLLPWDIHYLIQKHKKKHWKDVNWIGGFLNYEKLMKGVNMIVE